MRSYKAALIFLAVWTVSCERPPVPPEVRLTETQAADLRGAGVSLYYGQEFNAYLSRLNAAQARLRREDLKAGFSRHYGDIREEFMAVLRLGGELQKKNESYKLSRRTEVSRSIQAFKDRIEELDELTITTIERGRGRRELTRAAIMLKESENLLAKGRFDDAEKRIKNVSQCLDSVNAAVASHMGRYLDRGQVATWRRWANETIAVSRNSGTTVFIISKLERTLTVYRNGKATRSYEIGLGFNGYDDKRYAGDNATPEGRYRVIRKIPSSHYYKALLINYPNEEDRRRFASAKRRGEIPGWMSIGGSIEIHGGGEAILTRGCVSLDNNCMDNLYDLASVGTPVTIVGTLETDNSLIKTLQETRK